MVTHMKTTVELPDRLLEEVKRVAREEGTSMRELMIEGLRSELARRRSRVKVDFVFPTHGVAGADTWPVLTGEHFVEAAYGDRS